MESLRYLANRFYKIINVKTSFVEYLTIHEQLFHLTGTCPPEGICNFGMKPHTLLQKASALPKEPFIDKGMKMRW